VLSLQDPQDAGPGYRNVIGLPGGVNSPLFKILQVHGWPVLPATLHCHAGRLSGGGWARNAADRCCQASDQTHHCAWVRTCSARRCAHQPSNSLRFSCRSTTRMACSCGRATATARPTARSRATASTRCGCWTAAGCPSTAPRPTTSSTTASASPLGPSTRCPQLPVSGVLSDPIKTDFLLAIPTSLLVYRSVGAAASGSGEGWPHVSRICFNITLKRHRKSGPCRLWSPCPKVLTWLCAHAAEILAAQRALSSSASNRCNGAKDVHTTAFEQSWRTSACISARGW
jgi:hypothetical protein